MDVGATICRARQTPLRGVPGATVVPVRLHAAEATRRRPSRRAAVRPPPAKGRFPDTNRWLRGRILDRLRAAPDERWIAVDAPSAIHEAARVRAAATAMAADGLVEIAPDDLPDGPVRARLRLLTGASARATAVGYASGAMGQTAATSDPTDHRLPADDPSLFELDLRGLRQRWAGARRCRRSVPRR